MSKTIRDRDVAEAKKLRDDDGIWGLIGSKKRRLNKLNDMLAWYETDEPRTVYKLHGGGWPDGGVLYESREEAEVGRDDCLDNCPGSYEDCQEDCGIIDEIIMTGREYGNLPYLVHFDDE
ncbi:MAG: hypothetical protein K8L99_25255 [Anaerolineae bacterium]|nr:hypothetical protein [Anaerolineae bacterium]